MIIVQILINGLLLGGFYAVIGVGFFAYMGSNQHYQSRTWSNGSSGCIYYLFLFQEYGI